MPRPKSTTRPRRPVQSPQTELAKIGKALSPDADLDAIIAKLEAIEADKLKVMWDNRIYHFKEGDIWRPNPAQQLILDAWKNPQYRTFTFCGANRVGKCQTYQTLIETPDGEISIGKLFERGKPFDVYAWDGEKKVIANATAPFKKDGLHDCYRITMSDGRWIEPADFHRILTDYGWKYTKDLYDDFVRGGSLCHHVTRTTKTDKVVNPIGIHMFSPSESSEWANVMNVHKLLARFGKTVLANIMVSFSGHQFRLLPRWSSIFSSATSPIGMFFPSWLMVGEPFVPAFVTAKSGDFFPIPKHKEIFSAPLTKYRDCGADSLPSNNSFIHRHSHFLQTIIRACNLSSIRIMGEGTSAYDTNFKQRAFSWSRHNYLVAHKHIDSKKENNIINIEPIGTQEVYDFSVPGYHNYCAGGLIHHNTNLGVIIAFSVMFGEWPWSGEPIPFPHKDPRKIRYVGQGWESHIKSVVEPELKKLWPKSRPLETKKNNQGIEATWKDLRTGSTLEILSNNQESDTFEGWFGDLICIEENQRVLMANGSWKAIKDVQKGEYVWTVGKSHERSRREILNVIDNGTRNIIKITLVGGISLLCTPEHEIYVRNHSGWAKDYTKQAKDLTHDDKVYCPIVDGDYGTTCGFFKIFHKLSFFVGAWIGDGWNRHKSVMIATANIDFRKYFEGTLPSGYKLVHRKKYDYEIRPSNGILYELLDSLGLIGKKAYEKFIPSDVFTLDTAGKVEFLRGLFATDGWITSEGMGYGSTSERLVRDLGLMLKGLGIHSTIHFKKSQKVGFWRDQWFLNVSKSGSVLRFAELLKYVPGKSLDVAIKMAEKRYQGMAKAFKLNTIIREDYKSPEKSYRRSVQYFRVKSVEEYGMARVCDLTVDRNHNFICEGIKVSNCWDEPGKRANRIASARGLIDRGGRELFVATLLKEAWMHREIIKARLESGAPDPSVFNVNADISVNIGFGLTQENVDQFAKSLRPEEKAARIEGKPSYLGNLVLPDFKRELHVIERFPIPLNWIVDISIDFHPSKPWAVLFEATGPMDFHYACDFIHEKGNPKYIAEEIIRKSQQNGYHINSITIDPLSKGDENAHIEAQTVFKTMEKVFRAYNHRLETASKDKDNGIVMLNDSLKSENGMPQRFIFRDMGVVIEQLEDWMYDPETYKPSKENDDFCEVAYRIALRNTRWFDPYDRQQRLSRLPAVDFGEVRL